ncbi:MAG: hypothetical protein UU02_C0009G0030 [Candidatus Woesebacteria bacterium GW2011_GWA1_40_43]|uniref:Uncharacterized protein n=1 Tax=Candidatus Woesebacteria bacterium GW2011_GWA1_40_43 TaxID=1618553 RepID=A0A0G0SPL4_9BACT|nr:MAG: hypothetical protein UU02_C0009G0030 [Candidatus Woesebacteria bacterium GW2011_GWA1_40_43]
MTSLTKIAITSRKVIRYGIYLIIFLIVGRIFLDLGVKIYKKVFPAPPPAPTVRYGKLTKIPFPENGVTAKLTYTIETAEGGLPTNIPTQAKVYFMPKTSANLLSLDTAKSKAAALGFGTDVQQVSDTVYKFKNSNYPSTLQMNIITGTFSISYDLISDKSPIDLKPPVAEVAASDFRSFLSEANVLPGDLTGSVTHDFLKISNGQLVSALSLSEANFVKINLFRKNYQQIIASEYHYNEVDESQYSTYPIKTPTEALTELQAGKVFIANLGLNENEGTLKIRRVFLAYFDPDAITEYYQPIYVFEGDNGFIAYLPAVISDYYQAQQ